MTSPVNSIQPPPAREESIAGAEDPGALDTMSMLGSAARIATQLPSVAGAGLRLAGDLLRVAAGNSDVQPARNDWRFADPTWAENPLYRRLMQAYLATSKAVTGLVEDADLDDWRQREQARFLASMVTSTLAPTNTLIGNPAALKRTMETGGVNLVQGFRHWLDDVRHNGGLPSQVDRSEFVVGRDVALSPGAVVFRDEVLELIQYNPSTPQVHERPLLIVPPQINKFYIMDLTPGRSMIEYAVSRGVQTFAISWRNPGPEQATWDLDTYGTSILDAIDAARAITDSPDVNVFGLCAGGITIATVLNHLAATGDDRVHCASFGVTLLDWSDPSMMGAFSTPTVLGLAQRQSRGGIFPGSAMASVFTWMRPNDLIWNYWVNNYLMGNKPKPFDILAWNNDKTNLPSALHSQFLDVFKHNALARPGQLTVLGSPVDLSKVEIDTFITGGTTDHITPWRGCYRSCRLFGGTSEFVLAKSGHVQTLVSPVENPRAVHWVGRGTPGPDPDEWRAGAEERKGSWWQAWLDWVTERSGPQHDAPGAVGDDRHPALDPAPGTYVHGEA